MTTSKQQMILASFGILTAVAIGAAAWSSTNTVLANIQQTLGVSVGQLQWMMNIYGIFVSATLVTMGRLADMYGRKRIYAIGVFLTLLAALGDGLAGNGGWLIAAQALMGIAGAILMPVSLALYTGLYPENRKSIPVGIWSSAVGIALALGPVYSGFMVHWLGWRWVFLLFVPLLLLSLLLLYFFVEDTHECDANACLDIKGMLCLMLTIGAFVTGLLQSQSWRPSIIFILFLVALIGLVVLLSVERRAQQPIIRQELFRNRRFILASTGNCINIFFIWAIMFMVPLYLQNIRHQSALMTGLLMMAITIPLTILGQITSRLYQSVGAKPLMLIGFMCFLIAAVLLWFYHATTPLSLITFELFCVGLGWGFVWTPSNTAATSTLPQKDAGLASGTFITLQEMGGSMGLAVVVTISRMHEQFLVGLHDGAIALVVVSILGLVTTSLMRRH